MGMATAMGTAMGWKAPPRNEHLIPRARIQRHHALTRIVRNLSRWPSPVCYVIALAVSSTPVPAAEWRIIPRVDLRETYTDNIRLAERGQEESDWITEVNPGVSIAGNGARLKLFADYTFRYRMYLKNNDANGHSHLLRSNALMDVWDRKLFLQASGSILPQDISTLGALPASDVNITPNRTEARQATVSPYWVSRLGSFANLQARYTWSRNETDGVTASLNSGSQGINVSLTSGLEFSALGWSLVYFKQNIESTTGQFTDRELESITGSASYRLLPTLSALLTVGRDDNTYGAGIRGNTSGNFHSAGFQWTPSNRTRVRAEMGKRYYGDTAVFNAEHRTRLTTWNISYSEQIVATPGVFSLPTSLDTASTLDRIFLFQIPDPVERQQLVQAFITQNGLPATLSSSVDFLTNQVSLSKRLQGVFALRGVRSTLLISIYRDDRRNETAGETLTGTDPFSLSDTIVQTGYSAIMNWRFSNRTSGSVSLGQIRSEYPDIGRDDTNTTVRVGVTHQFQPKVRGTVEYRWLDRDSTAVATVRENAITGTLSLAF